MTPHKNLTPREAYARLADRCATTEICTGEALEKLRQWGLGEADSNATVQRLVDERFIDDGRFARAFVRDRVCNGRWGLLKVRRAMQLKRLDNDLIDEAIADEVDDRQYFGNLAAALRSKGRNMPSPLSRDDRMKLMRFAMGRGYEPGLVSEMVADEEYWREENADS